MTKGAIYYTDNRLDLKMMLACQEQISKGFKGEIVSVSLKPINFGKNIVVNLKPGITTLNKQILIALEASSADAVFFLEHDLLYSPTHFDFTPSKDNISYYNTNVWRWDYSKDRFITYDFIRSLSGLCINRQLAIGYYKERIEKIEKNGWTDTSREPRWARIMGHEPGRIGNSIPSNIWEQWKSEYPNIDIRHAGTVTRKKCDLSEFKHPPSAESWKETTADKIDGWNLKSIFNLET